MAKQQVKMGLFLIEELPDHIIQGLQKVLKIYPGEPEVLESIQHVSQWAESAEEGVVLIGAKDPNAHDFSRVIEQFPAMQILLLRHIDDLPPQEELENLLLIKWDYEEEDNSWIDDFESWLSIAMSKSYDEAMKAKKETGNKKLSEVQTEEEIQDLNDKSPESNDFHNLEDDSKFHWEKNLSEPPADLTTNENENEKQSKESILPDDINDESSSENNKNELEKKVGAVKTSDSNIRKKEPVSLPPELESQHTVDHQKLMRTRSLQRNVYTLQKYDENRMVGIWSPLGRMGVTTLATSLAFYLAEQRVYTAVLEGLSNRYILKDWLKQYASEPDQWESLGSVLFRERNPEKNLWSYKKVSFLPMCRGDVQYEWDDLSIEAYMTATKLVDVTLIDLPTGKMQSYTQHSLKYLDELWIVVDDSYLQLSSWKDYISGIKKHFQKPVYLIGNRVESFSRIKKLAEELEIELLTELPAFDSEARKNNYQDKPLYFQTSVQTKLYAPFELLAGHLLGSGFKPYPNRLSFWGQIKNTWKS